MIVISDLSPNYLQEITATEMSAVVGGFGYRGWGGYSSKKIASVSVTQVAIASGYKSSASNYSYISISQ
jgi:hypothetical protein